MASELILARNNAKQMLDKAIGPQGILTVLQRKLLDATKQQFPSKNDSLDGFRLVHARTNGLSTIFKFERELRCLNNIVIDSENDDMIHRALARMDGKLKTAKGLTLENIMAKDGEGDSLVRFLLSQNLDPNLVSALNRACADLLPIDSQLLVRTNGPSAWNVSLFEEGKPPDPDVGYIQSFCKTFKGRFVEQERALGESPAVKTDIYTYDEYVNESRVKFVSFDILLSQFQVRETELGPIAHLKRILDEALPQIVWFPSSRQASLGFRLSSYWNEGPVLIQQALIRTEPDKLTYIFELPTESWYLKIDGSPKVIGPLEFRMN